MRWLKNIIPKDTKDYLNANPGFQWLVIVVMIVVGVLLIKNGVDGIKIKKLRGKNGRVFEGAAAQVLGVVYIVLGVVLPIMAIATKF